MVKATERGNGIVEIVLVGIGGYGRLYAQSVQEWQAKGRARICAVVDPMAELTPNWPNLAPNLAGAGIPCYDSIEAFDDTDARAHLAVISSPIAFHAGQSVAALRGGMNVLCEKPMAATVEDALHMRNARDASGRFLEIGYQWSFSEAVQRLKSDILAGRLGAPRELKTWVAWPRGSDYYSRNNWAGRIRDHEGRWVLDSPANNATAHFLHNMLYVLGPSMNSSARPIAITAECYRANPIESFDACCCRVETAARADVFFFTAHCVKDRMGPVFRFVFDEAVVEYDGQGEIIARFQDGREQVYGDPGREPMRKLGHAIDTCRSPEEKHEVCGPEAAMAQTLCVHGLHKTPICDFPSDLVARESKGNDTFLAYVPGLEEAMRRGFEQGALFSEMKLPWAVDAQRVEIGEEADVSSLAV
jgi:predicted dehydrogenase